MVNLLDRSKSKAENFYGYIKRETLDNKGREKVHEDVNHLVKSLKKSKYLEYLQEAIIAIAQRRTEDDQDGRFTNCCPVERVDVGKKRDRLPHIVALRLFRFPFVRKAHNVKSVANCKYQLPKNLAGKITVCVNPLHYEFFKGNKASELPPICFSRESVGPIMPRHLLNQDLGEQVMMEFNGDDLGLGTPMPGTSGLNSPDGMGGGDRACSPKSGRSTAGPLSPQSVLSEDDMEDMEDKMDIDEIPYYDLDPNARRLDLSPQEKPSEDGTVSVEYQEVSAWATVNYYEKSTRVGNPFNATTRFFVVDGFHSNNEPGRCYRVPGGRLCIGSITGVARPDDNMSDVANNIGKGIRFYYCGGDVYAECLSASPIWIQSVNCNQVHGWSTATVVKITCNTTLKIFSNEAFAVQLADQTRQGYNSTYSMSRICTARISFGKGWGKNYKKQYVSELPSWIEVQINSPMHWVDRVLSKMNPTQIVSSRS